jgi:DNA repair protein SbcD/Mre11
LVVRLLHTADWHVGKTIRGRSRTAEFEVALDQVVAIAVDSKVDVVLVAGDLYEQRAAPPEADRLVFDALIRLHRNDIPVVAIPGNHDSAARMDAMRDLLKAIDVDIAARVLPPDEGGVVTVPSRDGTEEARVACVPFVPERRFAHEVDLFDAPESWFLSYAEGMGGLLEAMTGGFRDDATNVLLAHLYAGGAKLGGGEREATVGLEYAVPPARLPATAAYVALGHIHRPQRVPGAPAPTRYAGSLLQLDFGEVAQTKSVVVVEASARKPATVEAIPITAGRPLMNVEGTIDELAEKADGLDDAYLRVFVDTDGPVPGIADQVRELLPNAVDVHLRYERAEVEPDRAPLSSLSPREQFLSFFRSEHGGVGPEPALLAAFDEVASSVGEG